LELLVDGTGRITEAWFEGMGCAISQAAASILVRHVEGRTFEELSDFRAAQMLDLLGVWLAASREKCGLLAFCVLETMLGALRNRTSDH
jgi:nitrogen fixation NifU-like protein